MLPRTLTFLVLCGFSCSFYTRFGVTRSTHHKVLREDPELKELLTQAETLDAEWLQSVFGTSLVEQMKGDWQQQQQPQQNEDDELTKATTGLAQLGYSSEEMAMLKPSLRQVILEKQVMRPKDGLPEKWLLLPPKPLGGEEAGSRRRPQRAQADEPFRERQRQVQRSTSVDGARKEGRGATRRERTSEGEGEAFSWRGNVVPPTDEESRQYARARSSDSRSDVSSSSSNRERSTRKTPLPLKPVISQRGKYGESDVGEEEEEGPANFWPDKEEFKDLLLEESEWRVDLLGNWIAPMVREETKWRYDLYKAWLGFLDEGLGDGFDIVSEDFGQGYRDMDMDLQRARPRRYEAYEAEEEEGEEFWEEDEDEEGDEGEEEREEEEEEEQERAYNDDARERSRDRETYYYNPPPAPSFSSQSVKVPSQRSTVAGTGKLRQKKAAAYKERIESAIGESLPEGWTSVEEEERQAERMRRYGSRAPRGGGGGYYLKDPLSDRDAWFGEDVNESAQEEENLKDAQESRRRSNGEVREDWEMRENNDRNNNDWWDNAPDYSVPLPSPSTSLRRRVSESAVVSPSRSPRGEFSPTDPYRRTSRQRGDATRRSGSEISSGKNINSGSSSGGGEKNEGEEAQTEEEFRKAWENSKNRKPV